MRNYFLVLSVLVSAAGWADDFPVQNFAKQKEFHTAVLSPQGDYVAVQRSADEGKRLVAIVSTKDLSLQGHIPAGTNISPFNPFWANDRRLIVQLTEELGDADFEQANGELLSIDFDGKKERRIIQHQKFASTQAKSKNRNTLHGFATVVHRLPAEEDYVIIRFVSFGTGRIGTRPSLYKIHVVNGKTKQIADAPSYNASFVFSPSGELLYSIGVDESDAKTGRNRWVTHRFVDKGWQRLEELSVEAETLSIVSTADNADVYVSLGYMDKPNRVYRFNLESGERELLFAHAEVDPSAFDFDRNTGRLIAVHFDAGYPDIHLVDPTHVYSQWYPSLLQAFDGNRVRITSSSDDKRFLLLHVTGDKEPGQFHLVDTEAKELKYLFNAASWIDPQHMASSEPISFEARDGLKIHGYLTKPVDNSQPTPLIVMPHGGPHGVRDTWQFDPEVQFLASRGYAVLQINFRGSDGYGWSFAESGYGNWGTEIQYDIIDGTRWAANLETIDSERICIVGASFGGYAALMAPTIAQDLYKCAVGVVGPYNLELMWNKADIQRTTLGQNYLQKAIGRNPEKLRRNSPLYNVNKLTIPVFLVHGKKDWRVDVEHYEQMVKALKTNDHPHQTFLAKQEGHGFYDEENRLAYLEMLEEFLNTHIGP